MTTQPTVLNPPNNLFLTYIKKADELFDQGVFKDALNLYLKSENSNQNKSLSSFLTLWRKIGITNLNLRNFQSAVHYFKKILQQIQNPSYYEQCRSEVIRFFVAASHLHNNQDGPETTLTIFVKLVGEVLGPKHVLDAELKIITGNHFQQKKLYQEAIKKYLDALEVLNLVSEENQDNLAKLFNNIGSAFYQLGQIESAINSYYKSLDMYQKHSGTENIYYHEVKYNLAIALQRAHCSTQALELLKDTLRFYEDKHDGKEEISSICNIMGTIYSDLGENQKAQKFFEKAIKHSANYDLNIMAHAHLGKLHFIKGTYDLSLNSYLKVQKLLRGSNKAEDIESADTLYNMAINFENLSLYEFAKKFYERSKTLKIKVSSDQAEINDLNEDIKINEMFVAINRTTSNDDIEKIL